MTAGIRKTIFIVALLICIACWAYTFGTLALFGRPSVGRWTAMVTVSAIATEVVLWTGAILLGWSAFANRRRLWARIRGKAQ